MQVSRCVVGNDRTPPHRDTATGFEQSLLRSIVHVNDVRDMSAWHPTAVEPVDRGESTRRSLEIPESLDAKKPLVSLPRGVG